jgi:hypothetical protein
MDLFLDVLRRRYVMDQHFKNMYYPIFKILFSFFFSKDELQKLAGQIEYMKIVHMQLNNPHLRSKPTSYFNHQRLLCMAAYSPLVAQGSPTPGGTQLAQQGTDEKPHLQSNFLEMNEGLSVKLSPAAELVSEKV